jgi:hypothetical protein
MTRAEKIQAAIDALPNATGGEWAISHSPNYGGEHFFEGPDGEEYEVGPALLGGSTEDSVARAADATLISAARELAEEVVRLRGGVRAAIETILTLIGGEPPDPNCSCHVNPPCSDCVDHQYNREALADLRKIALMEDGTCCGNEQRNMGGGCTNCGDPSF